MSSEKSSEYKWLIRVEREVKNLRADRYVGHAQFVVVSSLCSSPPYLIRLA